jgi:hypothetical protein
MWCCGEDGVGGGWAIVLRRYATSPVSFMIPCIYREYVIQLIRWDAYSGNTAMNLNADGEDQQLVTMMKRHHAPMAPQNAKEITMCIAFCFAPRFSPH